MKVRDLVVAATVVCLGLSGYGPEAAEAQTVAVKVVALGSSGQANPSAQANMAAAQREAQPSFVPRASSCRGDGDD